MSYFKKIVIFLFAFLALHFLLLQMFHHIADKKSELNIRQNRYFNLEKKPNVLFLGDSRTRVGFEETLYPGSFSLAYYGEGCQRTFFRLKYIFENERTHPKVIVLPRESLRYTKSIFQYRTGDYFYYTLYSPSEVNLKGISLIKEWCNYFYVKLFPYSELFTILKQNELEFNKKINRKFSDLNIQERKISTSKYLKRELEGDYNIENLYYGPAIEYMNKSVGLCKKYNVKIIFVKYPLTKEVLEEITNRVGEKALINVQVDSIARAEGIPVIDFERTFLEHDDYFIDCHHLNGAGRSILTPALIKQLDSVINVNGYLK